MLLSFNVAIQLVPSFLVSLKYIQMTSLDQYQMWLKSYLNYLLVNKTKSWLLSLKSPDCLGRLGFIKSSPKGLRKQALRKVSESRLYESSPKALRKLSESRLSESSPKALRTLYESSPKALRKLSESRLYKSSLNALRKLSRENSVCWGSFLS